LTGDGTVLQKSGIDLTGIYKLGDGLTVNGSTIDVQAVTGFMAEPLDTPQAGSIPVYSEAPYNQALWEYIPFLFPINSPTAAGDVLRWTGVAYEWGPQYSYAVNDPVTNLVIGTNSAVFTATGSTNYFVVPTGVETVKVTLWGGSGNTSTASTKPGLGGYATGYLSVVPTESLVVLVATPGADYHAGGFPGGGTSTTHGGGGGYSGIFRGATPLAIAGGGGGMGYSSSDGGNGGGLEGSDGSNPSAGATGGTQAAGGEGAGYLQGANTSRPYSGGGGGGYYGGGTEANSNQVTGGAGGSSYIGGLQYALTYAFNNTYDDDYQAGVGATPAGTYTPGGPGLVVIRW